MIYYPSKGKFEGISIPSISDSFTLLIDYYGINFLVLDGQATRPKPLVFPEPGFLPSLIFHLNLILAALAAHNTPFQKGELCLSGQQKMFAY
jgi:hypothetical protein